MADDAHYDLLTQVAFLYYEQEMTQTEVAEKLGLSRVKVYRLLKEAKEKRAVQIIINWRIQRDTDLEAQLMSVFGLEDAIVLHMLPEDSFPSLSSLGQLVARHLENLLKDETTMAICLGRSTFEVINAIRPDFQANVTVVQAIGSMPIAMQEMDSSALARQLAEKLGGAVAYLASPPMVDSAEAATVLRRQQGINHTLTVAQAADIALVGIGNLDPTVTGFVKAGYITPEELLTLNAEGAVGDIAGRIYRLDGSLHPSQFNDRIIGITLEELSRIPCTIAIASGLEKAQAILGALRTGAVSILGTDSMTAAAILSLATSE